MKEREQFLREGYAIIEREYHAAWAEMVDMFYTSSVDGMDLNLSLDILRHLTQDGVQSTFDWLNNNYSPWTKHGTAIVIAAHCSQLGKEFKEYYAMESGVSVGKIVAAADHEYIDMSDCKTLDEVVYKLQNLSQQGLAVQTTFNGVPMFSSTTTIDGAYSAITWMTKAEYENTIGNALVQMSYCQSVGAKLFDQENANDWDRFVYLNFMYSNGLAATVATDLIQEIMNGVEWEEIKQAFYTRGYLDESLKSDVRRACVKVEECTGIKGIEKYLLKNGREPIDPHEKHGPIIGDQ